MTKPIEIYTATYCGYCKRAKELLQRKGLPFTDIDVTDDEVARAALVTRAGGSKTVPQIFIDGKHIGGCDDLHALDASGELDRLVA